MVYVCTVVAGLRHTGRIYPRSSQKRGWLNLGEVYSTAALSSLVPIVPAPSPHWNNFTAQSLVCTCSMSKTVWLQIYIGGFVSYKSASILDRKNPGMNKVQYFQKKLGRRNSAKNSFAVHTLYRKSNLCIPRKGIARPQSQLLHSCVCEQSSVYISRMVHIFGCSRIERPIQEIYKSLTV
jgi:hypothetical protein